MNKILKKILIGFTLIVLSALFIFAYNQFYYKSFNIELEIMSKNQSDIQLFYADKIDGFVEDKSVRFHIEKANVKSVLNAEITYDGNNYVRLDFDETKKAQNEITNISFIKSENKINAINSLLDNITTNNCQYTFSEDKLTVISSGEDPYIVFKINKNIVDEVMSGNTKANALIMTVGVIVLNSILILLFGFFSKNKFTNQLIKNKELIWNLSKNDFKTKYAGSFFGILWAFVQPVVTIVLYWFVFQVGFRSGDVGDFPFVLWLIVGLVPWFFFQDSISAGTNCLIEYSYLVKKMVFNVEILPFVKVISSLFVHLFFIIFTFIIFALNGYFPTIYTVQVLYYLFCSIVLVIGITFISSSIMVFFKDLGQIIQIILQIGMWMTPIMWNKDILPQSLQWLLELNPMYYIVDGFRDSFIGHIWFWNKMDVTINFWLIVIFLFSLGIYLFKKLKVHFADVL